MPTGSTLAAIQPPCLLTDHKNLLAFFDDKARPTSHTKPNRERLTRWGLYLAGLNYEIFHIKGEENRLADLGSRWGNRFATEKAAAAVGLRGGPRPLMKRILRTKAPAVSDEVKGLDLDLGKFGVLRGQDATLRNLKSQFSWTTMEREVQGWRLACLQCIKLYSGEVIPRPIGSQLMAERPGEMVSLDYIKLGNTRAGLLYVLMLVDRFTRLVMFLPTGNATGVFAARGLVRWASQHGLPQWLITDGASHFKNEIMKELAQLMGIEHHITLAYCPWANGSVEIVGRDLLWTLRVLTSEFRAGLDEWDLVLPLVQMTINHRERGVLGDRSALEVMTGRKPASTTYLAVWAGVKIKEARKFVSKRTLLEQHCARLEVALARLHEKVKSKQEARQRQKALRAAGRQPGQAFHRGDYVMVSASSNQANPFRNHNFNVFWQGPYEVVAGSGPTSYQVKLLGDTEVSEVHWRKMRRLAGPEFEPDEEVVACALHDRQRFKVQQFDD